MSVMFIGDIHIGSNEAYIKNIYKLHLKNLERAIKIAIHKGIEHIILAGDVFDSPNPKVIWQIAFMRLMRKHKDVFFHIIVGNHDWKDTSLHALKFIGKVGLMYDDTNYKVYENPEVVTIDNQKFFMCSHPHLVDVPSKKVDWCVGHFAWNGAISENGFSVKTKNSPKGRWLLGDFHTHQSGDRYVYAGSIHQVTWSEDNNKGYMLIDEDGWTWEKLESVYSFKSETISSMEDWDKLSITSNDYVSLKLEGGFLLPSKFREEHPNVVRITASNKKTSAAKRVLLGVKTNSLNDPLKNLKPFLENHKINLTDKEISYALKLSKKVRDNHLR